MSHKPELWCPTPTPDPIETLPDDVIITLNSQNHRLPSALALFALAPSPSFLLSLSPAAHLNKAMFL